MPIATEPSAQPPRPKRITASAYGAGRSRPTRCPAFSIKCTPAPGSSPRRCGRKVAAHRIAGNEKGDKASLAARTVAVLETGLARGRRTGAALENHVISATDSEALGLRGQSESAREERAEAERQVGLTDTAGPHWSSPPFRDEHSLVSVRRSRAAICPPPGVPFGDACTRSHVGQSRFDATGPAAIKRDWRAGGCRFPRPRGRPTPGAPTLRPHLRG